MLVPGRSRLAALLALVAAAAVLASGPLTETPAASPLGGFGPGQRVLLDAHNAYPYQGSWADRIDRALSAGLPLAIEQDLVWLPGGDGSPPRSIVSHGDPFTGEEPGLREHFFERIRPVIERAITGRSREHWPLITLNLDFKTNEPEHHAEIWKLLGEYEAWLTTAERTGDDLAQAPLRVGPVLVLTGDNDEQQRSFQDIVPVGARLRLFGAVSLAREAWLAAEGLGDAPRDQQWNAWWAALPRLTLPRATNYRRWWNSPWAVIEREGQSQAGDWSPGEDARLRAFVRRGHDAGLWVRYYTLNGHDEAGDGGWTKANNFGSLESARVRWRAAIAAGVDFVATDQYELFDEELRRHRRTAPGSGARHPRRGNPLTHVIGSGASAQRPDVAGLVSRLTRASTWTLVEAIRVDARMFHPQGMVKIGDEYFVSSVEVKQSSIRFAGPDAGGFDRTPGTGVGHLFRISREGRLLADRLLGEDTMYHPGGMDFDGRSLWVPLAEYRPNSRCIVYRVDPRTLKATEVLRVADHIGALAVDTADSALHGLSWGSRRFYRWTLDADGRATNADAPLQALRRENPSHYVDYQDCKYAGQGRMLCTGVADMRERAGSPAFPIGGLDLVSLADARPIHQVPVLVRTPAGRMLTQNPSWFEVTPTGLRGYFLPDDDDSTIYVYDITP
jgi:hypothetical protein